MSFAPIPLGPFALTAPLGRGGMGEVWAGTAAGGVPVAVKVITDASARESRYLVAFRNEVRAVAGLDHPGIVQVFDFGEVPLSATRASAGQLAAGSPFLVMEMLSDGSLRERLPDLTWPVARDILLDLLAALAHAHARGVLHRDLKPDNVLWGLDSAGLRLTDFGVAQAMDREPFDPARSIETLGGTMGTPAYMAPEQVRGLWRDQGPWTDLYAVGSLAWELVGGRPPLARRTPLATIMAQITEPLPDLEPRFPVPAELGGWLARLLEKEPADRFRRAADAAHALRELGQPEGTVVSLAPLPPGPPPDATLLSPELAATGDFGAAAADATVAGEPEHDDIATSHTMLPPSEWSPAPDAPAPSAPRRRDEAAPPPIPASWRGARERPAAARLAGVGLGLYALRAVPFVGREPERDLLWQALLDVAQQQRTRVVALTGAAGYGKSRLASWLAERAHELGAAEVLWAPHAAIQGPGLGVGAMIARHVRALGLPRAEVRQRLEAELHRLGADDPGEVEALTEVTCPASEAERTPGMVRFASPREAWATVQRFLGRLAARRPVLLWLDDVQWGRQALELVSYLMGTQGESPTPVLAVLTARSETLAERSHEASRLAALLEQPEATALEVGPLAPEHRPRLLQALLGLDDDLARRVDARTGGNPLFATQLVGEWVNRGVLTAAPGGFRIAAGREAEGAELPESLHQIWAQRVERVVAGRPAASAVALELAAILGPEVHAEEWRDACAEGGLPPDWDMVEALLDEHLAKCGPEGPSGGWSYVHGMLRESLERRAREGGRHEAHHRACAHMLATRDGAGVSERMGLHLLAAGDFDDALEPLARAAAERLEAGDYAAVADLLDRHAGAAARLTLSEADPRTATADLLHARLARVRGALQEALDHAARAEAAARRQGWPEVQAGALIELGRVGTDLGRFSDAEAWLHGGIDAAATANEWRVEATGREALGLMLLSQGRAGEAEAQLRAARSGYDAADDRAGAGRCEVGLARICTQSEASAEARRHCRQARDLFQAAGARNGLAACENQLGELARRRGDLAGAEQHYREAQRVWTAMGSANAVFAQGNLGLTLSERGDLAGARPHLEAALARFEARGQAGTAAVVHACLLPCAAAALDLAAFDEHLERATALLAQTGLAEHDAASNLTRAGDLRRDAGDTARSRRAYTLAASQWRALGRDLELAIVEAALAALDPG